MARPLRVQFSGALYHVTARGNERKPIFRDERDRPAQVRRYLSQYLSADAEARSAWRSRPSHPAARMKDPRGRDRPSSACPTERWSQRRVCGIVPPVMTGIRVAAQTLKR